MDPIIVSILVIILLMWIGSFLLVPVALWFEYRKDVKKYGKEYAKELWSFRKRKRGD